MPVDTEINDKVFGQSIHNEGVLKITIKGLPSFIFGKNEATADLGIAMGKGTDSAIETADIVLMQDHLGKLPSAVRISKKVNKIIKFNITLALGLKLIALLLTIPGLLTLWIAILSDMGATVLVTLISLTIMVGEKRKSQGSLDGQYAEAN